MLIIRQKQIDVIAMGDEDDFVKMLITEAKAEKPDLEEKYDDESLGKMVRGAIEKAESYGFAFSQDITKFVMKMFKVAPNFDEQAEIKAVLDDENTPPDQRFDKLESPLVSDTAWDEAVENYDEDAWNFEH